MSVQSQISAIIGIENPLNSSKINPLVISAAIEVFCPFCFGNHSLVSTWGTYQAGNEDRQRFMCKVCNDTFNLAKVPGWQSKFAELVWKLSQLTIENGLSIKAIAKEWNVPYSTIHLLVIHIKEYLSDHFEQAKILHSRCFADIPENNHSFRVIFYDEGFLRLQGLTGYLVFTLNQNGEPLTVKIENDRSAETVHNHFLSAITQLGGIDVIIADGAPAILCAVRALRTPVLFIQQIHSGTAKRARIYKIETIPNRKKMIETIIELHTGSLLANTEAILTVKKRDFYPKNILGTANQKNHHQDKKTKNKSSEKRSSCLTPEEASPKKKSSKKTHSQLLKGDKIHMVVGSDLNHIELSVLDPITPSTSKLPYSLPELQSMLVLARTILPDQFISSNRAEVFNAVHDRLLSYQGRKSVDHANRDLCPWVMMKFYPQATKTLISRHHWRIPYSLLKNLLPLMISEVKFS